MIRIEGDRVEVSGPMTMPDAAALLATLQSRGSLHAIFGSDECEACGEGPAGGLAFEWHVGLLHLQVKS